MVDLDDSVTHASLDKSDMRGQIRELPGQCRQAWHKALNFSLPPDYADIDKVLILGVGGSAIGGDLLKTVSSGFKKPIILVNRDYDLPAWADDKTLVIAASYSGNTEETLSAFTHALALKCKKLVISTGGKVSALAAKHNVLVFIIEHVSPPRAALGYSLLPLLGIMRNLGFSDIKPAAIDNMAEMLESLSRQWGTDNPAAGNPAKELALKLQGKVAVIYGAGILSDVARRWKTQINENSKTWAFFEILSELNHNAVAGYHYPKTLKEEVMVILLRCSSLHPRILQRYQITAELLQQSGISHEFIDFEANGPLLDYVVKAELQDDHVSRDLAYVMSAVLLGDWVSYYLAILNEVDPTPVPEIDFVKKRLSEAK